MSILALNRWISFLLPFRLKRRVKYLRRGLINLGNTCFLNCVLQALAGSPIFLKFLGDARNASTSFFSRQLEQVLQEIHSAEDEGDLSTSLEYVNPSAVYSALQTHRDWWQIGEQQDSGEALNAILEVIESELTLQNSTMARENDIIDKRLLSESQLKNSSPGLFDAYLWPSDFDDGIAVNPFRSIVTYDVTCSSCHFKKERVHEMRYMYTLSLDASTSAVEECFSSHFAIEKLEGVYCDVCTLRSTRHKIEGTPSQYSPVAMRMGILGRFDYFLHEETFESQEIKAFLGDLQLRRVPRTMYRCLRIVDSPSVLVLHLNRASFDMKTGESRKLGHCVSFPFRFGLDSLQGTMTDCSSSMSSSGDDNGRSYYTLVAVLVHTSGSSSTHFGHYYSCVLDRRGRWLGVSDREVWPMTAEQVKRAPAFLLFYEKIRCTADVS